MSQEDLSWSCSPSCPPNPAPHWDQQEDKKVGNSIGRSTCEEEVVSRDWEATGGLSEMVFLYFVALGGVTKGLVCARQGLYH